MKKRATGHQAKKQPVMQVFPPGWDENHVQEVIAYYENQKDEEAAAEDEAARAPEKQTLLVVPTELVPEIRKLIAKRRGA